MKTMCDGFCKDVFLFIHGPFLFFPRVGEFGRHRSLRIQKMAVGTCWTNTSIGNRAMT